MAAGALACSFYRFCELAAETSRCWGLGFKALRSGTPELGVLGLFNLCHLCSFYGSGPLTTPSGDPAP